MIRTRVIRRRPRATKRMPHYETGSVRGFYHIQLLDVQTGEIVGESRGENLITDAGKQYYQVRATGGLSSSLVISHLGLSTKTNAVAAADTTIAGEVGGRKSMADTTNTASNRKLFSTPGTLQMVVSWAGSDIGATPSNIASIAAFNSSNAGTLASAATYSSSQWTSDQNVNVTYEWRFA